MSNDKKPDFSNVQGGVRSTEQLKPDFSNVESRVTSTEEITGGEGGGGSTGEQTYTVEKGDNLSTIAKQFYGRTGSASTTPTATSWTTRTGSSPARC